MIHNVIDFCIQSDTYLHFLGGKDFAVVHDLLDTLLYELHFEMVIDLRDALMHVVCRFILSVLMDVVFSYLTQ